jgi:hypothetical protein
LGYYYPLPQASLWILAREWAVRKNDSPGEISAEEVRCLRRRLGFYHDEYMYYIVTPMNILFYISYYYDNIFTYDV